jgi:DNA polymerase/3'-5' exonuclease PolX
MENAKAVITANRLMDWLRPACDRIEIAGSTRREKPEVGDIEIVAIPKAGAPRPVFGQRKIFPRMLEQVLDNMQNQRGLIEPIKGGEKYKQFWLLEGRVHLIKIDLFLVEEPRQWGLIYLIRTGPADFSKWMVTPRSKGGALLEGYFVRDGYMWKHGDGKTWPPSPIIDVPEEADYFRLCELEWVEPRERQAQWMKNR